MLMRRIVAVLVLILPCLLCDAAPAETRAKNVILLIADGSGFNTWRATSMYQGKLGQQVYDGPAWSKLACCTYPLTKATRPTGKNVQDASLVYDPAKAWDTAAPAERTKDAQDVAKNLCAAYRFLTSTATDSAAAASALSAGQKTYDNAINWSDLNRSLAGQTIAEIAKRQGKSVGAITSVQWSHATPAGLGGAHNVSRNSYVEIANEMLSAPYLDVIMGAGNPDFDDSGRPVVRSGNGKPQTAKGKQESDKDAARYVGGLATWKQLKSGKHSAGWNLIETKAAFDSLTSGPTPRKVVGTAQVATTLQFNRVKAPKASDPVVPPFSCPFNSNVPTLETMAKGALNCLDDNPDGFYLMIEGGAVDWANHANRPERMIEEFSDFLRAAEAVVRWVETSSSWDETLVIFTADHETGLLWGPKSDTVPFDPIVDQGKGEIPGLKFNYKSHSNSLVPLYARGPGSERFEKLVRGTDATAAAKFGFSGRYLENTAVAAVIKASMAAAAEPARASREAARASRESARKSRRAAAPVNVAP